MELVPGQITTRMTVRPLKADGQQPAGVPVYLAVRPEEIELRSAKSSAGGEGHNVLQGRVASTLPAESHYRIEVDCGVPVVALVSRGRFRETPLRIGDVVEASFPPHSAHLIPRGPEGQTDQPSEGGN